METEMTKKTYEQLEAYMKSCMQDSAHDMEDVYKRQHMARRLVGPNYRILVPATVLTGSVLMTYADLISRTLLSPREIPVGIVAAVIGAPYFLYLLIKT